MRLTVCIAAILVLSTLAPCHAGPWRQSALSHAELWTERMNDPLVASADGGALRIEVAPGKEWAIAAMPAVTLPASLARIRVRVGKLVGPARWLVRLYGDVRGTGATTVAVFEGMQIAGEAEIPIDPRMAPTTGEQPVMVQLGIEGPPGSAVTFSELQFVPGPARPPVRRIPGQMPISAVDLMPNLPQPLKVIDWNARAKAFDRLAFDWKAHGDLLPLIWLDNSRINMDAPTFGLPSYVGDTREAGANQESITCMGAVLGASLAGIDKSRQDHDYVKMCEAFVNRKNGSNLVLDNQNQGTGGSFWYEIFPHMVFYALADLYPGHGRLDEVMRDTARRWREAIAGMSGDFDHTAYDLAARKTVDNGQWKEPDAAAGLGWMEYTAWHKFREPEALQAADTCIAYLSNRKSNPYYEVLLPWGALAAARMNAELGRSYNLHKMVEWSFGVSDCRGGWGIVTGRWGRYDISGLAGSIDNLGGYAFAMNTFAQAGALVPMVRYCPSYSRAIGKWMLNLVNSARLFYPDQLPTANQCCGWWKGDPGGAIAYEGLRASWEGQSPYGTGDPVRLKWGPKTDLGLYGGGYVGILGGIVRTTSVPGILQLDCLRTDFHRDRAYPTWLVYNPYADTRRVSVRLSGRCDLYDVVSHKVVAQRASGRALVQVPGDRAMLLVELPTGNPPVKSGGRLVSRGVTVDYGRR